MSGYSITLIDGTIGILDKYLDYTQDKITDIQKAILVLII